VLERLRRFSDAEIEERISEIIDAVVEDFRVHVARLVSPPEVPGDSRIRESCLPSPALDFYLSVVLRRRGEGWRPFLRACLSKLDECYEEAERQANASELPAQFLYPREAPQLLVLATLRRLEGRWDPLEVVIEPIPASIEIGDPLRFRVTLKNVDAEGHSARIRLREWPTNYGRSLRWRIEARGPSGRPLPIHNGEPGSTRPSDVATLRFGEVLDRTWDLVLPAYAPIDQLGAYSVEVVFHESLSIGDFIDPRELICIRSQPLRFTVAPRSVVTSEREQAEIAGIIAGFPEDRPVRTVVFDRPQDGELPRPYPRSHTRKLLAHGWAAVEPLIRVAIDSRISSGKRAWVLALLYNITRFHDPRWVRDSMRGSVLGTYCEEDVWPHPFHVVGTIDPDLQLRFARERWQPWIDEPGRLIVHASSDAGDADSADPSAERDR
jgi:hypothetical protein